jgi:hypothetical protein
VSVVETPGPICTATQSMNDVLQRIQSTYAGSHVHGGETSSVRNGTPRSHRVSLNYGERSVNTVLYSRQGREGQIHELNSITSIETSKRYAILFCSVLISVQRLPPHKQSETATIGPRRRHLRPSKARFPYSSLNGQIAASYRRADRGRRDVTDFYTSISFHLSHCRSRIQSSCNGPY